jgi:hypothetical protein
MAISRTQQGMRHRRQWGGAVVLVLLLLLVLGAALGYNYARNYGIDREEEKQSRPFARYSTENLAIMAEGYRIELGTAEKKQLGGRVQTRERYYFGDKVKEFERVQGETRRVRDRAIAVAEIRETLAQLEAEQERRSSGGQALTTHLTRMFRI